MNEARITDEDGDDLYLNVEKAVAKLVEKPERRFSAFVVNLTSGECLIVSVERPSRPPDLVTEAILVFADGTEVAYALKRVVDTSP